MTEEGLNAFYAAEYRNYVQGSEQPIDKDLRMQFARAKHLIHFSKPFIKQIHRCLDIGSSTGILLETFYRVYKCEGVGIEPGQAYASFSREKGFHIVSDIQQLDSAYEGSFDLVSMGHTLEHIPEPVDYLVELRERWISPSGYLLLEVPNLYGHHAFERAHLIAFSKQTLRESLQQAGYKVLRIKVHGHPRSRLIPLYITVLAQRKDLGSEKLAVNSSSKGVRLKRRQAMMWRRFVTRIAARWAWLPWPEINNK
jgi:SAM-dependent methyltransferase